MALETEFIPAEEARELSRLSVNVTRQDLKDAIKIAIVQEKTFVRWPDALPLSIRAELHKAGYAVTSGCTNDQKLGHLYRGKTTYLEKQTNDRHRHFWT
jgi:uncharacterized protein GlcG (DUF336 family)